MQARIAPSIQIEAQIEHLLLDLLEDGADIDRREQDQVAVALNALPSVAAL